MKKHMQASDIGVGVVGYGGAFNMGAAHLREMRDAGMTPVAVAEVDPERLEVARKDFPGIEAYSSVAEMLKKSEVHLVSIITPHNTHAALGLQCLKAGRHVVVEKPMAVTTAECDRMIAEARRRGVVISTYHNRHWDGCILNAVDRIGRGVIGEVFRIEAHMGDYVQPRDWWRTSKSLSGGILYDWGVHLLEYALQIIRSDLVEVSGYRHAGFWASQTKWKGDANEDEAHLVARFAGGEWVSLTITQLDAYPKGRDRGWLEITGTKGTYVMSGPAYEIRTKHPRTGVETVRKGANPQSEGWRYYRNVAEHLVEGSPLVITPEWSRRPIHILDLAGRSAQAGRALRAKHA